MKVSRLVLRRGDVERLSELAVRSEVEICGFLLGRFEGDEAVEEEVVLLPNRALSPVEFRVSPEDIYRAITAAEEKGLEIVGVFHSHPAAPRPSVRDVEGMKLWPVPWLIFSMYDGTYGCYIIGEGGVERIECRAV